MQVHPAFAGLTLAMATFGIAKAQMMSIKKVDGKTVSCMHSGLTTDLKDCGTIADWYTYVFVGSITTITPAPNDENVIQIVPGEVFAGKPDKTVSVLTSQAACLPKLAAGDRWLFYLRKVEGKPIVLDYFGNDSLPVANAQTQLETLRCLKKIGEWGLLRGQVVRGTPFEGTPVPGARVMARRASDKQKFASITDQDGRYEFQPLPAGEYKITVKPIGSYRPQNSQVDLNPGACWDLTLSQSLKH